MPLPDSMQMEAFDMSQHAAATMPLPDSMQMETFDMSQHAACPGPWSWAMQYMDDMTDLAWHPETPQKNAFAAMCGTDDLPHLPDETPQKPLMPPRNGNQMMEEWTPQKMVHVNHNEHTLDMYGSHAGELEETRDAGTPQESSINSTFEAAAEICSQAGSWPSPPRLPKSPCTPPRALARSVSPQSSIAATPAKGFCVPETPSPERLHSSIAGYGSRSPPRDPIQTGWFSCPQATMWSPQMPPLCNYGMPMIAAEATET